jgi:hypothetical protein
MMNNFKATLSWTIYSSIAILILACIWHFVYGWLGESPLVAWLAPVNESVWEHLKLTLWPMILVWFIMAPFFDFSHPVGVMKAATCIIVSMILANALIMGIHYVCKGGFGITGMAIDVASLIIGVLVGQIFTSIHLLGFEIPSWINIVCWVLLIITVFVYAFFSYSPAALPIFEVPNTAV